MTEQIKILLNTIIPTVDLAAFLAENIDTNNTGFDDEFAKHARQLAVSAKALRGSLPESTVARGLAQTKAFCDNVKNSVAVIIAGDLPRKAKIEQCEMLLADLSDDDKIFPAKKGKDAEYIKKTIASVTSMIATI